jgi:hypothetical protein
MILATELELGFCSIVICAVSPIFSRRWLFWNAVLVSLCAVS